MKKNDFNELWQQWWRCVRLDVILRMRDIYINSNLNPLTKFSSSSRSTMRWSGASHSGFIGKSMETETRIWSEFHNGGKTIVEKILGAEERNKSRRTRLRITVRDPSRKVNYLSKVNWDRKIRTELPRSISSTRIGESVLMMDIKVSKDKHIRRCVDQENFVSVRWNRIKNHA